MKNPNIETLDAALATAIELQLQRMDEDWTPSAREQNVDDIDSLAITDNLTSRADDMEQPYLTDDIEDISGLASPTFLYSPSHNDSSFPAMNEPYKLTLPIMNSQLNPIESDTCSVVSNTPSADAHDMQYSTAMEGHNKSSPIIPGQKVINNTRSADLRKVLQSLRLSRLPQWVLQQVEPKKPILYWLMWRHLLWRFHLPTWQ